MNNLPVKSSSINLPAAAAKYAGAIMSSIQSELTTGVTSGFPVLSFRGKVWRVRKGGVEQNYVDAEGEPVPYIELVLLRSNPQPSKIFYEKAYDEGTTDAPTCWSADGIKPDTGVQQPVSKLCASCPKNVWGSKITPTGAKTKACSDARRMAVMFKHELETKGADAHVFLLRIPPASLNPLKDYAEKVLGPKGVPYFSVVTRIGFDTQMAYPKLTFRAVAGLSDEEFAVVEKLRGSEDVSRILAESHEFIGEAGTTDGADVAVTPPSQSLPTAEVTAAPASPPVAKKAKTLPVDEEDVQAEVIEAPAPAPVKAKKAAKKPVVVEEDSDEDEPPKAAAAPPDGDFDSMLDKLLNR